MNDRANGVILLLLAICYGLMSLNYKTVYVTDYLGPSKYPLVLSILLSIFSIILIISPEKTGRTKLELKNINMAIPIFLVSLLLYIFLLYLLGYLIATIIYITFLGLFFERSIFKSFVTAVLFSFIIYMFFEHLFKIHLPASYIMDILK